MRTILTSTTKYASFRIAPGADPEILDARHGRFTIGPVAIEFTVYLPLFVSWRTQALIPLFHVFFILIYPLIACVFPLYAVCHPQFSVPVVLLVILAMVPFPRRFSIPKNALAGFLSEGRRLTFTFHTCQRGWRGITCCVAEKDADVVQQILHTKEGTLAKPVRFATLPPTGLLKASDASIDSFDFTDEGSVLLTADTLQFHGQCIDKQDRRRREWHLYKQFLIMIAICYVWMVICSYWCKSLSTEGWDRAVPALFSCIFVVFIMKREREQIRLRLLPLSLTFTRAQITKIDRVENHITLFLAAEKNTEKRIHLFTLNDDDADALEIALRDPQAIAGEEVYQISYEPVRGRSMNHFYGPVVLTIEDSEVSMVGKRSEFGFSFWDMRIPLGLSYAVLVYLCWSLYPVLCAEYVPGNYKGLIVLLLPLFLIILVAFAVIWVSPLFLTSTRSFLLRDITGLRRLGRQLTLYAPDQSRQMQKYVFHARTVAEAEAIEQMLAGTAGNA